VKANTSEDGAQQAPENKAPARIALPYQHRAALWTGRWLPAGPQGQKAVPFPDREAVLADWARAIHNDQHSHAGPRILEGKQDVVPALAVAIGWPLGCSSDPLEFALGPVI
jgi:hypothetical protein